MRKYFGRLNRPVLVLNQNYEPLQICTARRAMNLIWLGRAQLVESEGRSIRSISARFPFPSVVRVNKYIHIPNRDVALSRKNILKRDNHQCQYCGKKGVPLTIDHIIPRKKRGLDIWENLVAACMQCNNKKGARTPDEAGLILLKIPKKPTRIHYFQKMVRRDNKLWKNYLFLD